MTLNLTSFIDEKGGSDAVSPDLLSPLDLAFVGDTVFDLLVREQLVSTGSKPVKKLHALAVERVRAGAQAKALEAILPLLDEEEQDVFKRGRNAKVGGIPKNATAGEYHAATGLEALFGWLYLKGRSARIMELFAVICKQEALK